MHLAIQGQGSFDGHFYRGFAHDRESAGESQANGADVGVGGSAETGGAAAVDLGAGGELDMDLGSAIELEAVTQSLLMKSDDFAEFYAAWSEGRKPAWSGR